MKKFNISILIASSFFLVNCGGGISGDTTNHTSVLGDNSEINNPQPFDAPTISQAKIDKYLKAINDARSHERNCGSKHFDATTHLQWSDELYKAAYEHSQDMAKSGVFEHRGSGYESDWTAKVNSLDHPSRFDERIVNNGYTYSSAGENIAAGQNSIKQVFYGSKGVKGWLQSPGHCANIMNPNFTDIGMAMYYKKDDTNKYYWTQDFGSN